MKHRITTFGTLLAVLLLGFAFWNAAGAGETAAPEEAAAGATKLGILQLTTHPALDDIRKGLIDQLAERGYHDGKEITIDYQNGQGEQSNLKMLAEQFVYQGTDYVVGIGTTAAEALQNASGDQTPLILGAISDPVGAGLVESFDHPGKNASGVADRLPVDEHVQLIKDVLPGKPRVGVIYNRSEQSVASAVADFVDAAERAGLEVTEATITSTNELAQTAEQLARDVDAIYVPNDNTLASAIDTLIQVTDAAHIPVFPAVKSMVAAGGLATIGIDQYALGRDVGNFTADALEGLDLTTAPLRTPSQLETVINTEKAQQLGIDLPAELVESAVDVSEEGEQ